MSQQPPLDPLVPPPTAEPAVQLAPDEATPVASMPAEPNPAEPLAPAAAADVGLRTMPGLEAVAPEPAAPETTEPAPPEASPAAPEEVPTPTPEPAAALAPDAVDLHAQLKPGAGAPLVAGPPASVGGPVAGQKINTFFAIGALILLVLTVVVVVLLAIFVINLVSPR